MRFTPKRSDPKIEMSFYKRSPFGIIDAASPIEKSLRQVSVRDRDEAYVSQISKLSPFRSLPYLQDARFGHYQIRKDTQIKQ